MSNYNGIMWNLLFSILISWTGGLGILATRIAKNNWSGQAWIYVPIFWIPVIFSWPPALAVLFGFLDT